MAAEVGVGPEKRSEFFYNKMQLNRLLVRNPALRKGEKVINNIVGPVQFLYDNLIV
ncbi:hypothetical protein D3C74_470980 [compost metagenome]